MSTNRLLIVDANSSPLLFVESPLHDWIVRVSSVQDKGFDLFGELLELLFGTLDEPLARFLYWKNNLASFRRSNVRFDFLKVRGGCRTIISDQLRQVESVLPRFPVLFRRIDSELIIELPYLLLDDPALLAWHDSRQGVAFCLKVNECGF